MNALTFRSTSFDIIDRNGQPWLRLFQVGSALGYADPSMVVRVYSRHAEEFTDDMTAVVKLPSEGGEQETRIFSPRGCYALGMFARTRNAAEFRRWVLDVLEGKAAVPPAPTSEPAPAPKALPARILVRKIGDLSFFCKSGRPRTHLHNQPGTAGTWWDYPQHLKDLPWADGLKVGRGFFAEVAELAEHDEHAAYLVLESVLGIAWEIPAGNPQKNSCIEYGFAQAMAVAMMTGLRAMRSGSSAYAWGV